MIDIFPCKMSPMTARLQGSDVRAAKSPLQRLNMGLPVVLFLATPKSFNDGSPSKNNKDTVAVAGSASAVQNPERSWPLLS